MNSATKKPLWVEGSPYGMKGQLCLVGLMLRAMSKPWVEAYTQLDQINGRRHQHVTIVCMPGQLCRSCQCARILTCYYGMNWWDLLN